MIDGILPPRRSVSRGDRPSISPTPGVRTNPPPLQQSTPPTQPPAHLNQAQGGYVQPNAAPASTPPHTKSKRFSFPWKNLSKKQRIILLAIIAVIVAGGGGASAFFLTRDKPAPPPPPVAKTEETPAPPPPPTTIASPLTGVQVKPELAALPVTGVMIENSPDARPQAGLKDAGVVFEAIAESGITRFLALFQDSQPDYVGPIRSVRPYYLQWVQGYDAGIAHVGGSPEALSMIKAGGYKDLDQAFNAGSYQRVSTRYAPHNVYTSLTKLTTLGQTKGFLKSNFTGFARKADKPEATPTARSIDVTISSFLYNPHFDYDATTNSYKRSQAGKPHTDERSKEQINPKVVVVMVVPFSIAADRVHSVYATSGSGKAFIFQDGTVTEGIWDKTEGKASLRLGDTNGSPLAINSGQTWISVVGTAGSVAYKP